MSAQLAVTWFVLISAIGVFSLPFIVKRFAKNLFLDTLIRRLCVVLGLFLMVMNSTIVGEIANTISVDMREAVFKYMIFFGWAGYIAIVLTIVKSIFDLIEIHRKIVENKRMGGEDGEERHDED